MKNFNLCKTVYCYYFPEIREVISELTKEFPHSTFLKSIEPGLDDFHFPIIQKYIDYHKKNMPALGDFKHRYFTSGASEGIFHWLVKLKDGNPNAKIYTIKGEYEGYKEYSSRLGIDIVEVDLDKTSIEDLEKGTWFISNPSARNGNILPNKLVNSICKAGHKVIFDCTYVGLTKEYEFDLSHPNIIAVIASLSKPFGLYYYRIGFTFSREKTETLEANIWFKNIFSLLIADRILDKFKPEYFYKKYRPVQERIVSKINSETKLGIKASDVILLGFLNEKGKKGLNGTIMDKLEMDKMEIFRRGNFYRFCLTPYFLNSERGCFSYE